MAKSGSKGEEYLDFDWIKAGLEKRRANFSNLLCFETQDPRRRPQAKGFIAIAPDYREADLYAFNRWNGLARLNRQSGNFEPASRGTTGGYDAGIPDRLVDLKGALRHMDGLLKARRTVLFLEDLDAHREEEKDQDLLAGFRSWAHDRQIMANGSLIVLFVGSISRVLDDLTANLVALKRPPLASAEERGAILAEISKMCEVTPGTDRELIIQATAGLSIHQLRCVLTEAYYRTGSFSLAVIKDLKAELIRRSELLEIEEADPRGFASVGGYEAVKAFITHYIVRVLRDPARANRFAVPLPRGILFFGPPGTGKTLFAKGLAQETHLPFINLRTENLYAKYLGESGQRFAEAIRLAEQMSPAIVFVDEIDRFGRRHGSPGDSAGEETRRVFNQILEWLGDERRKAIIVGTTNRPEDLDEAFMRPGRLDYKIPFLYPGKEARRQILAIHLGLTGSKPRPPLVMADAELQKLLDELSDRTTNFSGAEIEQLVIRAKRNAFNSERESVVREDFITTVKGFRIDQDRRQEELARHIQYAGQFTDDMTFLEELRQERRYDVQLPPPHLDRRHCSGEPS